MTWFKQVKKEETSYMNKKKGSLTMGLDHRSALQGDGFSALEGLGFMTRMWRLQEKGGLTRWGSTTVPSSRVTAFQLLRVANISPRGTPRATALSGRKRPGTLDSSQT